MCADDELHAALRELSCPGPKTTLARPAHFAVAARMRQNWLATPASQRSQKRGVKIELNGPCLSRATAGHRPAARHWKTGNARSRKAQVVELKYFGGLSYDEMAEVLKISRVTVRRDWEFAKVWLYSELHNAA